MWRYRADGRLLATYSLGGDLSGSAKRLAYDSLRKLAWIAGEHQLILLDPATGQRKLNLSFSNEVKAIALDPLTGALWFTHGNWLKRMQADSQLTAAIDLGATGIREAETLDFDPVARQLWLGGERVLARFDTSGALIVRLDVGGEVEAIGTAAFSVEPTLGLIRPQHNALTNTPTPTFILQYGTLCTGQPCSLDAGYHAGMSLAATLDGQGLAGFQYDAASQQAVHTPANRLAEGAHNFSASILDIFGHRSPVIASTFTIDSVPPVFTAISPADGSAVTTPTLLIQGSVDDPTASVVLENLANWNGQGANPATQHFSYTVTLKPGLNMFTLTAIDKAGNTASKSLYVSYAASAVSVAIDSPTDGAVIAGDRVLVSGRYQGPPNTGITVNGVVAVMDGARFYASVPLVSGENALIITATTPDGAMVSKNVTVTNTTSPVFNVLASTLEGVAPLQVDFEVTLNNAPSFGRIDVDFDGDGAVDFSSFDPLAPIQFTYVVAGSYVAKFVVTDTSGVATIQALPMVVKTPEQTDAFFSDIWNGMNVSLAAGNKAQALRYLTEPAQQKYGPVFDILMPSFASVVASYSPLQRASVSSDLAEYAVNRTIEGVDRIFLIYFLRDSDGVWRLDAM